MKYSPKFLIINMVVYQTKNPNNTATFKRKYLKIFNFISNKNEIIHKQEKNKFKFLNPC